MPRQQCRNTINNNQDNLFPLEPNNLTTAAPEYFNVSEGQRKDLKASFMHMIEAHKEEINKSPKKPMKTQIEEGNE